MVSHPAASMQCLAALCQSETPNRIRADSADQVSLPQGKRSSWAASVTPSRENPFQRKESAHFNSPPANGYNGGESMGKVHLPLSVARRNSLAKPCQALRFTPSLSLSASEIPTRIHQTSGGDKCFNPSVAINFLAIICPEGNRFL